MPQLFISKNSIKDSIEYFKNFYVQNHMPLGLFFFLKRHNIFVSKDIFPEQYKEEGLKTLFLLGGLFDENETPGKYSCLFPFAFSGSINNSSFYNGATPFKGLLGRIKDTIDNTLIDYYLNRQFDTIKSSNKYSLKTDYIETIKSYLSTGKRISKAHFSAWLYRFVYFEAPEEWATNPGSYSKELTRLCNKKFTDDFKITNEESLEFFEDGDFMITPSTERVSGSFIRENLSFSDKSPEIEERGVKELAEKLNEKVELSQVVKMSVPHGKNILPEELFEILKKRKQAILFGPPGTGKTWDAREVEKFYGSNSFSIQFHPSTSYEEFIGGVTYDPLDGKLKPKIGCFLEWCLKAQEDKENNYLFFIDEINRGNIAKIFGEAITTLDRDYEVQLLFETKESETEIKRYKLKIPENLHILGTMNSADRSIALVDYALRRRFVFVRYYPNPEIVKDMADQSNLQEVDISELFLSLNNKLFEEIKNEDFLLGHSYFLPFWAKDGKKIKWDKEVLCEVFNYSVLPILEEYTYGKKSTLERIIGQKLASRVSNPDELLLSLLEQFQTCKRES